MFPPYAPKSSSTQERCEHLRANLFGERLCRVLGITLQSTTPVIDACNVLIATGYDLDTALDVYRGDELVVRVTNIGKAANLEINSKGTAFIKRRSPVRTALPIRQIRSGHRLHPLKRAESVR